MIFQHTLENVLSGKKTQTRRRINPGRKFIYRAGKDYAVQSARGAKAVARIEVVAIIKQPLGEMTEGDAVAEGFGNVAAFQAQWCKQYGEFDPDEVVWVIEFRLLEVKQKVSEEA